MDVTLRRLPDVSYNNIEILRVPFGKDFVSTSDGQQPLSVSKQAERQPYIKEESGQKLQRILIRYKSQFQFLCFMEYRRMDNAHSNFKKKEGKQMRLDKYLKVTRLIKRRTVANEACDAGRVTVNGKPAKASVNVKVGDIIEIMFGQKTVKVEVVAIADTTKKEEAGELFRYL